MAAVRSPSRAEGLPRGARAADAAALGDHRRAEPIQHPTRPDAPDDLQVGQALADVATIGILHERALHRSEILAEQLQTALHNRVIIEQALGVLAERTGLHIPDVFTWLRAHARRNRLRLSDIARGIIDGSMTLDALPRETTRTDGS